MDKTTPRKPPKASLKASRRRRQKAWRERRKVREAEALALLEKIGDDDVIVVTGKDYKPE